MRKYAYLKNPLRNNEGNWIFKIMLYKTEEGFYLFEYNSPDAVLCSSDRCYDSLDDLYEDWNDLIDERGWIGMEDPLPDCQHDAFIPIRVKGRDVGKPEWGKYETLKEGQWVEYPEDKFCRECGLAQSQEVNIEPINVEKKMKRRASELLPGIERPADYMPLMSDGLPARGGMPDPGDMNQTDYQPPVFRPRVEDVSIKHDKPVEIHSTEIDVFNLRCSYFAPPFDKEEKMKRYPVGDYCFHLIRTAKGARCRIEFHSYGDNREEEFDVDAFALIRLDALLKERDVAQLDGYSVHSIGAANHMDLLVQYLGGEQIAATGLPPHNNKHYKEEWFIDFFRNLSGAFGKNIFTDSFKEREQGNDTIPPGSWQCSACGQVNTGPFCSECGSVRPKE